MWHKLLIILFSIIFTVPCFAQGLPPLGISDEGGAVSRPVFVLDCSGAGVECSHSGVTGTITVSGGSGDHDAVTLAGQDYLSLSTQEITANQIKSSNINWATIDNIADSNINWTNFNVPSDSINWDAFPNEQGYITPGDINWVAIDEDVLTGINWTHYENVAVNWDDIPMIQSAGINWTDVEALTPITEAMIGDLGTYLTSVNWDDAITGINWAVLDEDDLSGVNWADLEYVLPTASAETLGGIKVGSGLGISEGVLSATGKKQICFIIDGGGSAITTGAKAWVRAANSFTIGGVDITADQSGSCVVDIWKDTYANFPPTVADTITASAKPTLSTAQKAQDTTLTGWTTTVTAGDYLRANVDSCSTVTMVEVCIYE